MGWGARPKDTRGLGFQSHPGLDMDTPSEAEWQKCTDQDEGTSACTGHGGTSVERQEVRSRAWHLGEVTQLVWALVSLFL